MTKKIALLGSTGSIGKSTLRVARNLPEDIQVVGLTAYSDIDLLEKQIYEFNPKIVAVYKKEKALELAKRVGNKVQVLAGEEGINEVASHSCVDFVVIAIVGMSALQPTIAAINAQKQIGIASKEVLVAAGSLVMKLAKEKGVTLLPIDSEHSALLQCLNGEKKEHIARMILTASGGPFRSFNQQQLDNISVEEALKHPNWSMGPKVTIDSSTLMNKGLEMIEAHWLFDLPPTKIEVIVHPQSIIHSMIEFIDGSIMAQMCLPDMVLPIQYSITYPERKPGLLKPFDFTTFSRLEFFPPDFNKFPSLKLAYQAIEAGQSYPCYLNAANEVLVQRFLDKEISWKNIICKLQELMDKHQPSQNQTIEDLMEIANVAKRKASII